MDGTFPLITNSSIDAGQVLKSMKQEGIEKLTILPSKMKTGTPTWNNLTNFFRNVHLSIISHRS